MDMSRMELLYESKNLGWSKFLNSSPEAFIRCHVLYAYFMWLLFATFSLFVYVNIILSLFLLFKISTTLRNSFSNFTELISS